MLSSGMCNTNVDGRQKVMFALTAIRGIGRRISNIVSQQTGNLFHSFCNSLFLRLPFLLGSDKKLDRVRGVQEVRH